MPNHLQASAIGSGSQFLDEVLHDARDVDPLRAYLRALPATDARGGLPVLRDGGQRHGCDETPSGEDMLVVELAMGAMKPPPVKTCSL